MKIQIKVEDFWHTVDLTKGIDLSSTYGLASAEPRAWYAHPVKTEAVKAGNWVGDVKQGSAVNFFNVFLNPHGNGTHTECLGHISPGRESVNEHFSEFHCLAQYLCLQAEKRGKDQVVTLQSLQKKNLEIDCPAVLLEVPVDFPKDFSGTHPPYFEPELMQYLRKKGVRHFLTNLPSVDPEEDGGALAAHKAFWDYPQNPHLQHTITELVYFKQKLAEKNYFLNLQVAPLHNDASPSRPVVFEILNPQSR